jgi:hypothetical protein
MISRFDYEDSNTDELVSDSVKCCASKILGVEADFVHANRLNSNLESCLISFILRRVTL